MNNFIFENATKTFFGNRTFCHSCTPFDGGKGHCRDVMVTL